METNEHTSKVVVSPFGRSYEEFAEGTTYRHWPGKTITESDNNLFSLISMNHHPVHLDSHYAEGQHHGKILVVGTLVFSIVVGLSVRDISGKAIANLGYEDVRHQGPVFIGDTIYAETTVLGKRTSSKRNDRGIVHVETRAWKQDGTDVLSFRRNVLVPLMGEP